MSQSPVINAAPAEKAGGAAVEALSYCGAEARRRDNDRYLAALFAPARSREAFFALIAFNQEIARTREVVSEPTLGMMRLQWWRDAVAACCGEGVLPHHPVAEPLAAAVRGFGLSRAHFDRMIDGREADLDDDPPATLADLERYAEDTAAPLQLLKLEALGVDDDAARRAATAAGAAYALTGILRATAVLARQGRVLIPSALLEKHNCRRRSVLEGEASAELTACAADIAGRASALLATAREAGRAAPRAARPALLPAASAGAALKRMARVGYAPFTAEALTPGPWRHVALAWAAFTGRY